MDQILRTAGGLLGTELSGPVDLGGSSRSSVLRCRTADGGSVVVKAFTGEPEAVRCFASEAAALSLAAAGPGLLGVDPELRVLVMEDLGEAPTLADVLLGDDPKAAREGLLAWARALGRLAAGSVARRAEFTRLTDRFGQGAPSWADEPGIARTAAELPAVLAGSGIDVPPELTGELARIGAASGDPYPAFTPGDTCPDNNLLTPDGLRLIDFEAAAYQSVFLTAAYCRMPFATCWCVFRLPAGLARHIEETYRTEVVAAYPELAEDTVWRAGLHRAIAAWTVHATVRLLGRTGEDLPMHRTRRPVPTVRQLLRHRWETASTLTEFPALARTMERLLRDPAGGWWSAPLPEYPAFRR
ncbi:hypothetical protein ACF073_36325 [Streptomyces sp. NPDC015171]|uniref:hypothetical protein n=1 Tax=Streptomyces sp. NPDC015171 TaxID=3364945 RepID=UPI0036FDC304